MNGQATQGNPSNPAPPALDPREFQAAFFRRMGGDQQVRQLFDCLPGVYYFIKDTAGRYVATSGNFLQRMGLRAEAEIIALTPAAFYPLELADRYAEDDRQVIATGQPLLQRVEMWSAPEGGLDWCVTNKLPVRDRSGAVIGVMGTVQPHDQLRKNWAHGTSLEKAVDYIHRHASEPIEIAQITRAAGLSQRQLTRKFHELFGMSAREFIVFTRLQAAARDLIQTGKRVAEIAADHGFYDQSAFTYQFRRRMGHAPLDFRRRYRVGPEEGKGATGSARPGQPVANGS